MEEAKYYMTVKHHSESRKWEPCKATTLTAAKQEATRAYGGGQLDHTLCIAEATHHDSGILFTPVASRLIREKRWHD
jgi:hypothetical protein